MGSAKPVKTEPMEDGVRLSGKELRENFPYGVWNRSSLLCRSSYTGQVGIAIKKAGAHQGQPASLVLSSVPSSGPAPTGWNQGCLSSRFVGRRPHADLVLLLGQQALPAYFRRTPSAPARGPTMPGAGLGFRLHPAATLRFHPSTPRHNFTTFSTSSCSSFMPLMSPMT